MRFLVVMVLLVSNAVFLQLHSRAEVIRPRLALASFPLTIADWRGVDLTIDADTLKILGDGDFLSRIYERNPQEPRIELFVAYFPTQRTGSTIHSPEHCLPGSGWLPINHGEFHLAAADVANRYVIAKGLDRQVVVYWYQAHGRVLASGYKAKFYLIADALRHNRSDGALVRIITPLVKGESPDSGQERAMEFVSQVRPILGEYIPL